MPPGTVYLLLALSRASHAGDGESLMMFFNGIMHRHYRAKGDSARLDLHIAVWNIKMVETPIYELTLISDALATRHNRKGLYTFE